MSRPISKFAEVFGRLATVYTGTKTEPKEFQKLLSSKNFVTGLATSNVYGPAIYAVYDEEKYKTFYGDYGEYICKLAIDTTGFFSFNLETIKALYPSLAKNIQMIEISKEEFEKYVGIDDENGNLIGQPLSVQSSRKVFFEDGSIVPGCKQSDFSDPIKKTKEELQLRKYDPSKKYFVLPSYKDLLISEAKFLGLNNFEKQFEYSIPEYEPEYTAQLAIDMWKDLYPNVRGLLFNGSQDGSVAVIYDYDNSRILSYTTIDSESKEISESSKVEKSEHPEWSPSSYKEYMNESGGYSPKGGEQSLRDRARRSIDIAIKDGLTVDLEKSRVFVIEREYALDAIAKKISSGEISEIKEDYIEFLIQKRCIGDNKNIEKLKPIFADIANKKLNSVYYMLQNDYQGVLTDSYLSWRDDNKNLFNTQYLSGDLISLDHVALKNNPDELKSKIIDTIQYPDNIKSLPLRITSLNSLFDMFSQDFFKELYRKYAESLAINFPMIFLEGKSEIPDASSDISSGFGTKFFSKKENVISLYPDLVETAILNLQKINNIHDLKFIKNIPSNISSTAIDKIKELAELIIKSDGIDCNKIDQYNVFSSNNIENQKILDNIKEHVVNTCQGYGKIKSVLPPLPSVSQQFFYSGPGNGNTVTQEGADQIAQFLITNFSDNHNIYVDGAWTNPKFNSDIMAKYQTLKKSLPAPPPPPQVPLPPVPTEIPVVDEVTKDESDKELVEGEINKVEASFEFRRIKIARLISVLKSLGINNSELKRLI